MKVLLADDHHLVRDGLALLIKRLGDDVEIFEADGIPQALAHAENTEGLDLVILDLAMPGMDGFNPHFPSIVDIQCGEKAILL